MSKKHHGGPAPVPPGNRPHTGPANPPEEDADAAHPADTDVGAPFQEEDPKRGVGNYTGTGEHSRVQPGPRNDGDKHSQ